MNVAWWCSGTGQVWTWRYTPFLGVWVVAATFVGGYVVAHRRAGRDLDRALLRRWCLGVLALFVVSEWPLGQLGVGYLATLGIVRYVVYTFVAAPLLLSGLPTWLLDRWLPLGRAVAAVVGSLTRWPVALLVFNAVLFGTHLPLVVDGVKTSQLGSFGVDVLHLSAALIWWWPGDPPRAVAQRHPGADPGLLPVRLVGADVRPGGVPDVLAAAAVRPVRAGAAAVARVRRRSPTSRRPGS